MAVIDEVKLVSQPQSDAGMTLAELPEALRGLGLDLNRDPARVLNSYTAYRMEPGEERLEQVRGDVTVGSTCCPVLIQQYLQGMTQAVDNLHKEGIRGWLLLLSDRRFPKGKTGRKRSWISVMNWKRKSAKRQEGMP